MQLGKVKFFNRSKRYGFVAGDDGVDYFFHESGLSEGIYVQDGDKVEFEEYANPGDFIFVPPFVPHQEINASVNEVLKCILFRSGQEPVIVNLDIPEADNHNNKIWVDDIHRKS